MNHSRLKSTEFQKALVRWFSEQGRRLPWRETDNPYRILVSELMLQQTQVRTVSNYYQRWLERFPTLEVLAAAQESEVLHAWQGLGYYNRARNLHQCAKLLAARKDSSFPKTVDELRQLPGIGRYTAGAIASFAFNLPAPIVDGNIGRVLARLLNLQVAIESSAGQKELWHWAGKLADCDEPRRLNSALMELGALICTARSPSCGVCPVRSFCAAENPESLPIHRKRPKITELTENYSWMVKGENLLLEQQAGRRWRGLWCLPKASADPPPADLLITISHPITRFVVKMRVYRTERKEPWTGAAWHRLEDLENLAIPSPHRRAIERIVGAAGSPGSSVPAGEA